METRGGFWQRGSARPPGLPDLPGVDDGCGFVPPVQATSDDPRKNASAMRAGCFIKVGTERTTEVCSLRLYSATLAARVNESPTGGCLMSLFLQVLVTGLAAGAAYGLVAIAYTLIYRLTGVIHFALGELINLAVFATLFFAAGTGPVTRTNLGFARFLPALAGGIAVAVLLGVLVYGVALRPFLRRESLIGWVGVLVAVTFGVRGFLAASFDRPSYVFPDPFPFSRLGRGGVLDLGGGVTVQIRTFFVIGAGIALAMAAGWILTRTKFGRALQAIASTREGAQLVGIPIDRLLALAFGLAGALAALAAVVQAPSAPVSIDTGALLGLKGLVAALLVGFASSWRAFWAGLAVGVLEAAVANLHLGPLRLGPEYRDIVPLALALAAIALTRIGERDVEIE